MLVQGGLAKGRKIKAPAAKDIRPTSLKIKEALFTILQDRLENAKFLDIFAGFGTIGTEAVSRGAEQVYFVDASRHALSIIRENLCGVGLIDKCVLISSDAVKAVGFTLKEKFDIIYADPPYDYRYYDEFVKTLCAADILKPDGIFILEHYHKTKINPANFNIARIKKYGQTVLTFMECQNYDEAGE